MYTAGVAFSVTTNFRECVKLTKDKMYNIHNVFMAKMYKQNMYIYNIKCIISKCTNYNFVTIIDYKIVKLKCKIKI